MSGQRQRNHEPELSVIVPTFRLRKSIGLTLRSLEEQTLSPDKYEVGLRR